MSDSLLISIIALILFIVNAFLTLYFLRHIVSIVFQTLEREARRHDRVIGAAQAQLDKALDRLMTIKWEDFAAVQAIDDDQEGGQTLPGAASNDEEGEVWQEGGQWGNATRIQERLRILDEEEQLIAQDFTSEGDPKRGPAL